MTTYYLDIDGGNDSNDGTSFANRKKTLDSASDLVSAGDTIRVMGHPSTSLGNGTIKTTPIGTWMGTNTTFYVQISRDDITKSLTKGETNVYVNTHGMETGDTVRCVWNTDMRGVYTITKVDANNFKLNEFQATSTSWDDTTWTWMWNITGEVITLASACTKTIACTGTNGDSTNDPSDGTQRDLWTASSDITCSFSSSTANGYWTSHARGQYWEGGKIDKFVIGSSFGTGKAAYWATGTLDLSGYQQISYVCSMPDTVAINSAGDLPTTAGNYSLRLCTDATGDTPVHTIPIGVPKHTTTNYVFKSVVYDFGTNLNSSIQSIALYVDTDAGAQTLQLSNIIACKAASAADSLNLTSQIGLNTANDKFWYRVLSINGTQIVLNRCAQSIYNNRTYQHTPTSDRINAGIYFSSSGTHTIYKRETIKTGVQTYADRDANVPETHYTSKNDGTSGNWITISGGWNRTDMSTQDGVTITDGTNGMGRSWHIEDSNYIALDKVGGTNYYQGIYFVDNDYAKLTNLFVSECLTGMIWEWCDQQYSFQLVAVNNNQPIYAKYNYNANANYVDEATTPRDLYVNQSTGNYGTRFEIRADAIWNNMELHNTGYYGVLLRIDTNSTNKFMYEKPLVFTDYYNYAANQFMGFADINGDANISLIIHNGVRELRIVNGTNGYELGNSPHIGITTITETSDTRYGPWDQYGTKIAYGRNSWWDTSTVINDSLRTITFHGGSLYKKIMAKKTDLRVEDMNFDNVSGDWGYVIGSLKSMSKNHGGVSGVFKSLLGYSGASNNTGGYIDNESTIRHTASGYAWKFVRNSTSVTEDYPVKFHLGKLAVASSGEVTIGIWVRRASTTMFAKLVALKNTDLGVSSNASVTSSGSVDTWTQQTVAFTPNAQGFMDIELWLYGSSGVDPLYFDDFSAAQA